METDSAEYYEIVEESIEEVPMILDDLPIQQIPRRAVESNLAFWAVIDGVLLVFILGGNLLTILAVRFSRRLRSLISNMFVLSLAISDMVVGFTLPYHLAFYMKSGLGQSQGWCLLRFFLIILACCVSIWNLIAIAVDRYIAIVYPLHYSRYMTKKVALILLSFGWFVGATFALIPMFWNNWETATQCEFDEILPPWYMAGVITPGFSMVWVCMLIVYWRIWREASKHAKQIRSSFTGLHESPSDWKSVQVVLFILGCFSICWLPYFVIACAQIFRLLEKSSPMLYKGAFSLAMANSGMNPIIYAWKNSSFRKAFAQLLRCKSPDHLDFSQYSTRSNIHRKSSSLHPQDTMNTCTPPPSAINGSFNEFDERTTSHNGCNGDVDRLHHTRRVSLALTHSTPLDPVKMEVTATEVAPSAVVISTITRGKEQQQQQQQQQTGETTKAPSSNGVQPVVNGATVNGLITGLKGKALLIKQIECDGNGNTQLSIVNGGDTIKMKRLQDTGAFIETHNRRNNLDPLKDTTLYAKRVLNGRYPIVEHLSNGNHIISSVKNLKSQNV